MLGYRKFLGVGKGSWERGSSPNEVGSSPFGIRRYFGAVMAALSTRLLLPVHHAKDR